MTSHFADDVEAWAEDVKARLRTLARQSVSDLAEEMQRPVSEGGNLPVLSGFLRASFQVTVGRTGAASGDPEPGVQYAYNPAAVKAVIAGWDGSEPLHFSYGASYAAAVHYGTSRMPGRPWTDLAAQRWPGIVAANAARLGLTGPGGRRG